MDWELHAHHYTGYTDFLMIFCHHKARAKLQKSQKIGVRIWTHDPLLVMRISMLCDCISQCPRSDGFIVLYHWYECYVLNLNSIWILLPVLSMKYEYNLSFYTLTSSDIYLGRTLSQGVCAAPFKIFCDKCGKWWLQQGSTKCHAQTCQVINIFIWDAFLFTYRPPWPWRRTQSSDA